MTWFAPTTRSISWSWLWVMFRLVPSAPPPPPNPLPPPVYGVTMITFPELESCAVIERVRFAPMIPSVVMAITPMTIPRAARRERSRWSLTLLYARLTKISPAIT